MDNALTRIAEAKLFDAGERVGRDDTIPCAESRKLTGIRDIWPCWCSGLLVSQALPRKVQRQQARLQESAFRRRPQRHCHN